MLLLKNEIADSEMPRELRLVNGSRGVVVGFQMKEPEAAPAEGETRVRDERVWPLVRFRNGRVKTIVCESFEKEIYVRGKCVRKQVSPLCAAGYSLLVH